jgi:acyl-coenzyme A thioesterase PaaI-like protein
VDERVRRNLHAERHGEMSLGAKLPEDFQDRIHRRFARNHVMTLIGSKIGILARGSCGLTYDRRDQDLGPDGALAEKFVAAIADAACGVAALTLVDGPAATMTIDFSFTCVAPARAPQYVAAARVVSHGIATFVCEGEVVEFDDTDDGRIVATMRATIVTVLGR